MAQTTPVDIVRQASTLSILWGVLLIVFVVIAPNGIVGLVQSRRRARLR